MGLRLASENDELQESHDINVTPMLDVMLVLLIIFMVAAPLATVAVPVDLPESNAPADVRPDVPVYLSIREDSTLALGETDVTLETLAAALLAETGGDLDTRIYIRGDRAVPYGMLMEVMNTLRAEGYTQVGLVGLETPIP